MAGRKRAGRIDAVAKFGRIDERQHEQDGGGEPGDARGRVGAIGNGRTSDDEIAQFGTDAGAKAARVVATLRFPNAGMPHTSRRPKAEK